MMKLIYRIVCLSLCIMQISCIKDEAPNAEADIIACTVPADILRRSPVIENNRVTVMVRAETDLTALAPEFELTPGATISPASGTVRDFSTSQYYTVTSEDGNWTKEYEVSFVVGEIQTEYHFENVTSDSGNRYDVFFEVDSATGNTLQWGSGNAGFAVTGAASGKDSYPTCATVDGYIGKGARLVTRETGFFGSMVNMPIASGNLFMGTFNVAAALGQGGALAALELGWPFRHEPLYVSGYYKYQAGTEYQVDGVAEPDSTDTWDVYAVFYEVTEEEPMLTAEIVSDNFTHPNIVSVALLPDSMRVEASEWTHFEIPFEMKEGKVIDQEKLENDGYNVAIVAASSRWGNYFRGAPGSTLYIDELQLIYRKEE